MKVIISPYVSDTKIVRRTWKERLFSLPWRPFRQMNVVDSQKIYQVGDQLIVSPKTHSDLVRQGLVKNGHVTLDIRHPVYPSPKLDLSYGDVHDFDR